MAKNDRKRMETAANQMADGLRAAKIGGGLKIKTNIVVDGPQHANGGWAEDVASWSGKPSIAISLDQAVNFIASVVIVEQPAPGIFPDRVRAIEPDRVGRLDLDDAVAPAATCWRFSMIATVTPRPSLPARSPSNIGTTSSATGSRR
jgi:hypothetical protein